MLTLPDKIQIQTLQTAFESSYDGIHILDSKGRTLYINKACQRIEGITFEEIKDKTIHALEAEGIYSPSVTLKVLESNGPVTIIQKVKNGNEVLATGTPIYRNGKIDNIIVNSRDITELNALKRDLSEKAQLATRYQEELEHLKVQHLECSEVLAKSLKMRKIIKLSSVVAKVDSTILIYGESGVGKGVLSQYIHNHSRRQKGPFIKIDCSAIPETLFESELFGYEKGAFTGAEKGGKLGLLELANGGTVFLDELGEIPLSMQAKLLRAIQDREIMKVGGKTIVPLDIRIIAATNRDLEAMVAEKQFREDLFYRLNVVPITIPPLRERADDIYPLISQVVQRVNDRYNLNKKIGKEAIDCMIKYSWPGNIRELENITERMMVTSDHDSIDLADLPSAMIESTTPPLWANRWENFNYSHSLAEFDKNILVSVIEKEGSIPKAAKALEIDVTTLRRKLHKYGVST